MTHFLLTRMPRGGLCFPAIEAGKLQDDDGDITNSDDNSPNNGEVRQALSRLRSRGKVAALVHLLLP